MGFTRSCGACKKMITQEYHLELSVQVIRTDGPETQDGRDAQYDDYCDGCVKSGAAFTDLLSGLKKYRNGKVRG